MDSIEFHEASMEVLVVSMELQETPCSFHGTSWSCFLTREFFSELHEEKVTLKDVYNLIKEMKSNIETKYAAIQMKVEAVEKQLSTIETKLTEKVKEEAEKTKTLVEEELNTLFQVLEENFKKKKIARLDKAQQEHKNLEQYIRKNSVRLFGIKVNEGVKFFFGLGLLFGDSTAGPLQCMRLITGIMCWLCGGVFTSAMFRQNTTYSYPHGSSPIKLCQEVKMLAT